jgi:hypothetical protein
MKKTVVIFSLLVAGAILFPSCTKDLKNDIKKLKGQVDELKKDNQELKDQIDGIDSILGSNEPMDVTTTFVDDNGATRTVSGVYKFKSANAYTQWMINNGDGTYHIHMQRFGDVGGGENAEIEFTYNPTTKLSTNKWIVHEWSDHDPYYNNVYYDGNNSPGPAPVITITVNSFNPATGDISLNVSASGDAAYTSDVPYYWVPKAGKPVSTTLSFAGKLKLFTTE